MPDFLEYEEGKPFPGVIGKTAADSTPAWPVPRRAPEGAPNVLLIVLDDTGFGQIGCFGGLGGRIETPHMDRLAAGGLRYNNFHTTALCSPTRACLLTGRNHHSVGVASIMETATGYPGYNARVPKEAAMLPAVLVGERLQHHVPGQVAPGAGRAHHRFRPLRPLAPGAGLRALLRLPAR